LGSEVNLTVDVDYLVVAGGGGGGSGNMVVVEVQEDIVHLFQVELKFH
jgi:hypothetical protein